jgi:signal transduction histidine kinase
VDSADLIRSSNKQFQSLFQVGEKPGFYALEQGDLDCPEIRELIEGARHADGTGVEAEIPCHFQRMGHRILRIRAKILREPEATVDHILVAVEDVTEIRAIQEQVRHAARIEAVGHLAGGVAHDLNNQLTAVVGFTEFLVEGLAAGDPRLREAEEIRAATQRMADTTRQLLAFGRRQQLTPVVHDVNALLRGMVPLLRHLLGSDIRIQTDLAAAPAWILADPASIEQVVLNLAVNARDAMPKGGEFRLGVALQSVDMAYAAARGHPTMAQGDHWQLSISDTGVGMSVDTQSHLFEPFFTTKDVAGGSGLGLASVYGTVKQSNGWIWVASTIGKGTTFLVDIPCAQPLSSSVSAGASQTPVERGGATILVVDDEPAVLRSTARLLQRAGFVVLTANGGAEAVALMATQGASVNLILSDVTMPGMGGKLLGEHLKADFATTPVLYMSGHPTGELIRRKLIASHTPLLHKPFTGAELASEVRRLLTAPRPASPAHA